MSIDLNQLLQLALEAILVAVLPILVALLVKWVNAKLEEMSLHLDESNRYFLADAIEMAVKAAEQSGIAGLILNEAAAKKAFACEKAEQYLASFGVKVDLDVLADMIEAEVWRQFNRPRRSPDVLG